jgi:hypothetical protein
MVANRVSILTQELSQAEGSTNQDPLVALKQRELDLKAMDLQRKSTEGMMNYDLKENQIEEKLDIEKMKLENAEEQHKERINIAKEKIEVQKGKNAPNKKR